MNRSDRKSETERLPETSDQIPEGVIDPAEYRKMLELKSQPLMRDTMHVASDGTTVNIAMLPHMLRRKIEHLDPKEQEEIMEMKREYNVLMARITTAYSLAFGKSGRYGGRTREEMERKYSLPAVEEDVIELLGRMFTVKEVVRILVEDNGIEIPEFEVKEILRRHIAEIEKKREDFRSKVADVRLYNKRPRLEELAWMYSKMKMRYVALNSTEAYNCMLRTLEQIRKEAEGDVVTLNGGIDINIEATIQEHIQKEILKTINVKEIILGRVAARMNYDPIKLITGLHNSYYAKFVDIGGDYDENAEMRYPSNSVYNFDEIERNADTATMDMSPEPLDEEKKDEASKIKEMFLEKIRKQKREMELRQARWQAVAQDANMADENTIIEEKAHRGTGRGKDKNLPSKKKKRK